MTFLERILGAKQENKPVKAIVNEPGTPIEGMTTGRQEFLDQLSRDAENDPQKMRDYLNAKAFGFIGQAQPYTGNPMDPGSSNQAIIGNSLLENIKKIEMNYEQDPLHYNEELRRLYKASNQPNELINYRVKIKGE